MTVLLAPLTRPSDHFVLDVFVAQRALGDLDAAGDAHALVLAGLQRDVRLGGAADAAGQPHPLQGVLQLTLTLTL